MHEDLSMLACKFVQKMLFSLCCLLKYEVN